ncbi:TPA: DNA adenine methylase [Pseudomonas aeruginosa]|nr:DNA adenine methylase [Pseudomonas aeruginosa]HBO5741812.1 DNA adenine methylase [Pseudomonas aeruginosa]HEK3104855.1 DNA adenine methylase [Pseudomonas aeruginosa]HEK3155199.1 DNA adenine methylase [Pseudomonas aeruginosa]
MSSAPSFVTPLRYPGGKGRLGAWLAGLIEHNGLKKGCYVEPYAGGAGAAVYLLVNNHIDRIAINDLDPVIYAFWWAVINDTDRLVSMILETPVTMDTWHQQREIVVNQCDVDRTTLGFATFFLNRTNRSGIITGGVIGGQRQTGKYLIDARYNKPELVSRIRRIGSQRERIKLFNMDALQLLNHPGLELDAQSLIYLDPPYYEKGSQLYRNHYLPDDHQCIANAVMDIQVPWLVTYDNCDEIRQLYAQASGVEFSLHYSTHMLRPRSTEVMFFGNMSLHQQPWLKR